MNSLDLKYYFSVFLRRLPYLLVILAFISAIGLTVAFILPPSYQSTARMLVEPAQIPGELAQSTVPVNAVEQIQIIQQRLMTRANLLDLAERFEIYAGVDGMSADDIVADMRARTTFATDRPTRAGRSRRGRHDHQRLVHGADGPHGGRCHQRDHDPDPAGERGAQDRAGHRHARFLRAGGERSGRRAVAQRHRHPRVQERQPQFAPRQSRVPAQRADPQPGAADPDRARGGGPARPARARRQPLRADRTGVLEPRSSAARSRSSPISTASSSRPARSIPRPART